VGLARKDLTEVEWHVRLHKKKSPRPPVISGPASLITPSWNQVLGFLSEWEGLRRMADDAHGRSGLCWLP